MSIHPAMRPVRRMVQCEGIVSLAMPCFSSKPYVVTPHLNRLNETVQMRGHNIYFYAELTESIPNYHQILLSRALRPLCCIFFRPTQNGASATLGSFDWLDGFTESNRHGLFLAVCQKDNNILLFKWKEV